MFMIILVSYFITPHHKHTHHTTQLNPTFAQYVPAFRAAGVNAAVLSALDETGLEVDLGVRSALHRSAQCV
jgi:hypothetical protein